MEYDKIKLLKTAQMVAATVWLKAEKRWGAAEIGKMPVIEMNARLTSTAGRAWINIDGCMKQKYEKIDLSCFIMANNMAEFCADTIPHELAHFIAYRVYKDKGHGKGWYYAMQELGLPEAKRLHSMVTKRRK